ncbi:hypothetical protein [Synechococcus sp. CS-1328]|uniref:hypothetical protein n=1 Tax=Synechococcus sp. CS-1328 TaxID=2847976 RepID=UPI00288021FF|nr:hypothetical protein [Synechococcus sp. CS-1328]
MNMNESIVTGWSEQEQGIARGALDRAQLRAVHVLIEAIRVQSGRLDSIDSVWNLHDFLSTQRYQIEGRFDFRLDGILFVFASLLKEGLISLEELEGLGDEKLAKIKAMSLF